MDIPEYYAKIREQVDREFSCDHQTRVMAVKYATNGNPYYYRQCTECGNKERVLLRNLTRAQMNNAVSLDEAKENNWYSRRNARHKELYEQHRTNQEAQWRQYYDAVLLSPEWRKKRAKVLERDNHICQGCLSRPATDVHHLTYDRLGREMLFDLVAVCRQCHLSIHDREE